MSLSLSAEDLTQSSQRTLRNAVPAGPTITHLTTVDPVGTAFFCALGDLCARSSALSAR
jgi:hypothetical protein